MRVFVTGASGFIGGAIARQLAQRHDVTAMSRSAASDATIEALGATPVRCDLDALAPGQLPPCDAVIHCAAYVKSWGSREDFVRGNVDGTDRVLAAARAAGARRFVHMSTEAVLWRGQHLRDIDETYPYPANTPFLYAETKAEAERHVLAAADENFHTIALRPRFVWGPGDQTIVPEARRMVERGAFLWIDGGRARTSTTHVGNLVVATERALEKGRSGHAYFVTDGEVYDFKTFLTRLLDAHGVALPDRSLPSWLVLPLAASIEGAWRALGLRREPPLTRHAVALLCCDCTLRDDKARADLGYAPAVSVDEGLQTLRRQRGRKSEDELADALHQRQREAGVGPEAERMAEHDERALLHAEGAGHQERGVADELDQALEDDGFAESDRVAEDVEREPDLAGSREPAGEAPGGGRGKRTGPPVRLEDRRIECAGTRGQRRRAVGLEDPLERTRRAPKQTRTLGRVETSEQDGERGDREEDGAARVSRARTLHQQHDSEQREGQLGADARGDLGHDAGAGPCRRDAIVDDQPCPDQIAADLRDGQEIVDGAADPARPQRSRERRPDRARNHHPPTDGVAEQRDHGVRADGEQSPAGDGKTRARILDAVMDQEPGDSEDAEQPE